MLKLLQHWNKQAAGAFLFALYQCLFLGYESMVKP